MKIAVLFTNFGPYHLARVQAFHEICSKNGWSTIGIELSRLEAEYPWRSSLTQLPFPIYSVMQAEEIEHIPLIKILSALYHLLVEVQPDVLAIAGYAHSAMILALVWSHLNRKPTVLFSETTATDFPRSPFKERIKQWLVSHYQSALVGGQPQKRYLMSLGMSEKAIYLGYDIVGNSKFHPDHIRLLPHLLNTPYFLTINRFIQKKNLPFVINCYHSYRMILGASSWDLVLCGDGKLRSQLERQIHRLGLEKYIHLTGFLQQDEMLPYFAHAGCLIHASTHEQWGLVVNEAMAAGLPLLVSNRCGCYEDLLLEGVNGFGFDPENQQQLTELMLKVSSGVVNLHAMGQASLQHIQKYSPDYFAEGLKQAVDYAITKKF